MFIKTLRIENFQSHKDSTLNFHPNFNCIVGTGNSGKSSLVRALSFILFGQWEPSWVRNGATHCRISLTLDNGTIITREKGAKANKYIAEVPGLAPQVYENFGTHIPEEIEKLTHIFKAQIGDKEELNLNLSSQLDNLFLLSNPGSYKAKVLGKLSKAHYLDYALKEISKDKKRLSAEKLVIDREVIDLSVEIMKCDGLEEQKTQLETLGKRLDAISATQDRVTKLKALAARVATWKGQYSTIKQRHEQLQSVTVVNTDSLSIGLMAVKQLRDLLAKTQRFKTVYSNTKASLEMIDQSKSVLSVQYTEILKANQKCPTCFGSIDDHTCEKILESLNA